MRFGSFFLISALFVTMNPVFAGASNVAAVAPHEYEKTCRYFRHRANALKVQVPDSPFVQLGESCEAALARLKTADVYFRLDGRVADRQFLQHLSRLKRTITKMNVARFRERGSRTVQTISETGQFLIARRLGIFDAHSAWQVAVQEEQLAIKTLPAEGSDEVKR